MTEATHRKVRLFGEPRSPQGYALRDFLQRSVVAFEWVELSGDEDRARHLGETDGANLRLPIVELPNGHRLFAPTVRGELAEQLGWVSAPKLREYDVSIYGAGPAGLSAAVYAASEGLRTVLIERHAVGGQAGSSSAIENYMGFPDGVAGAELAERARQQAVKFGAELLMMREGIKAEFRDGRIIVDLAEGGQLRARANICATGVEWRKLGLVDEGRLLGRGLYYGAGMSEAPMCASEQVVVVGAGNSAGQAAMHLATYAAKVTMLVRGEGLGTTLSQYLVERITCTPNIEVVTGSEVKGLHGDDMLAWIDVATRGQPLRTMETSRLFVCIGGQPNTDWASQTPIVRDAQGYLVTGPDLTDGTAKPSGWTLERAPFFLETSVAGSFAAGDVRRNSVKRIASAVGEGAMAVTFVHQYLAESR